MGIWTRTTIKDQGGITVLKEALWWVDSRARGYSECMNSAAS